MRRSVSNYFKRYFQSAPPNEQTVWTDITKEDWTLIHVIEMEAVTDLLAQFSLGEVQKEGVASSYVLLFRKVLCLVVEDEMVNDLVLIREEVNLHSVAKPRVYISFHGESPDAESDCANNSHSVFLLKISMTRRQCYWIRKRK